MIRQSIINLTQDNRRFYRREITPHPQPSYLSVLSTIRFIRELDLDPNLSQRILCRAKYYYLNINP